MEEHRPRALKDYIIPNTFTYQSSIAAPEVGGQAFEIKTNVIQMVQNNQFGGHPNEDPHAHLTSFLEVCDTFKIRGANPDAIKLRLFTFSLRDKAKEWLRNQPHGTFTTWASLAKGFLNQYFPPSLTTKYRNQIQNFKQDMGESLYEAWERFKGLQRKCPHHGLAPWLVLTSFCQGLDYSTRASLDQAAGGGLMEMDIEEANELIEGVAQNYHLWGNERVTSQPSKTQGRYDAHLLDDKNSNVIASLSSKLDSLMSTIQTLHKNPHVENAHALLASCQICSGAHLDNQCPYVCAQVRNDETLIEDANALRDFPNKTQGMYAYNPYSNSYNPGLRDHPNFSWKNSQNAQNPPPGFSQKPQGQPFQNQGQRSFQNHGQGNYNPRPQAQNFQNLQNGFQNSSNAPQASSSQNSFSQKQEGQKPSLEAMMEKFMIDQANANQMANARYQELSTRFSQLEAHNKMLENQIASQATSSSFRDVGKLPSKTEDPKDCNAITLRSGTTIKGGVPKPVQEEDPKKENLASQGTNDKGEVLEKEESYVAPPPLQPRVPYPQRLKKGKDEKQFSKFVGILKKLQVNLPFTDVMSYMPSYSKFLKDILSNKRKIEDEETVALSEECSALIQNKMPQKLNDPGSFSIACLIGGLAIENALCDLGAIVLFNLVAIESANQSLTRLSSALLLDLLWFIFFSYDI